MQNKSMLSVQALSVGYAGRRLIEDLSLSLNGGELLAVVGHNGSGKSSLLKTLLGLTKPTGGQVIWSNPGGRMNLAYLGQRQDLDRAFPLVLADLVAGGAWPLEGLASLLGGGKDARRRRVQVAKAIAAVGLTGMERAPLHRLSGGELQRALFARAIVQDAPVIILDEPFQGVDQRTEEDLLAVIDSWRQAGRGVVLVSHNLGSVMNTADKALLLGQGQWYCGAPRTTLSAQNLVRCGYMTRAQATWYAGMFQQTPLPNAPTAPRRQREQGAGRDD